MFIAKGILGRSQLHSCCREGLRFSFSALKFPDTRELLHKNSSCESVFKDDIDLDTVDDSIAVSSESIFKILLQFIFSFSWFNFSLSLSIERKIFLLSSRTYHHHSLCAWCETRESVIINIIRRKKKFFLPLICCFIMTAKFYSGQIFALRGETMEFLCETSTYAENFHLSGFWGKCLMSFVTFLIFTHNILSLRGPWRKTQSDTHISLLCK